MSGASCAISMSDGTGERIWSEVLRPVIGHWQGIVHGFGTLASEAEGFVAQQPGARGCARKIPSAA